tara:strand:+ start:405 stop:1067 length:663 start_codon:yes stop_codon:yes gene_type:complete
MIKNFPSKEYKENIKFYKKMHREGYKLIDGSKVNERDAYDGHSTLVFAKLIRDIIKKNQIETMLDYGCGKGFFYSNESNQNGIKINSLKDYWKIDIDLYDPCYEKNSFIDEKKKYDLVISIDVLEHIPSQDTDWVLEKIISKAKKYVFINVACYSAIAILPNGENAHINVNEPEWWNEKILKLKKIYQNVKIICVCSLKENGKHIFFPLQYDDKITNYNK